MSNKRWMVRKLDGKVYGPVDAEAVREWIQQKRVLPEEYIAPEGAENWQMAKLVPEFANMFGLIAKPKKERRPPGTQWEPTFKVKDAEGKEYGPIDLETLKRWIREGRVGGETLIRESVSGEWLPLNKIPHLTSLRSQARPEKEPLETEDIKAKARKIAKRIKLAVGVVALVLVVATLSFGVRKANYLHRGAMGAGGAHYWEYENRVVSSGESVTVPAGNFTDCYRIDYEIEYSEQGKSYKVTGRRWYKVGIGNVKEVFTRREIAYKPGLSKEEKTKEGEVSIFGTINFSGELVSFKGPGAGKKPFPYVPGARLEYDLKAEVETAAILKGVTEVFAPPQNFRAVLSCPGTITLEDGKKYLRVVGTAGGSITRSEQFYRVEGNDIFTYGTRYMRNVSSPVKIEEIEPEVGSVFEGKITYEGSYSSTKQAKNMIVRFISLRIGLLTGPFAIIFLLGFIFSLKHNLGNLEQNVEQIILASQQKGEVLVGEVMANVFNWVITLILLGGFLGFAIATYKCFF